MESASHRMRKERDRCQEDTFSSVSHYYTVERIFCFSIRQRWTPKQIDFENTIPNREIERLFHIQIPVQVSLKRQQKLKSFRLGKGLYGLKDAPRSSNKLLFSTLRKCRVREMNTAACVFEGNNLVVQCYVGDLILFGADENSIGNLYHELGKHFQVKHLGEQTRFLGLDIKWPGNGSIKLS